mgnify:CR=1 FL=1
MVGKDNNVTHDGDQIKANRDLLDDPLISKHDLAAMLNVRERQIRRYRSWGWIESVIIQRRVFFRMSAVRKLIDEHLTTYKYGTEQDKRWSNKQTDN